jgi:2-polyprenyl-6-methoxyphenol hydroxylase-like FAD-dependent oxidoreductase
MPIHSQRFWILRHGTLSTRHRHATTLPWGRKSGWVRLLSHHSTVNTLQTPISIIGGGPCGLLMSTLLSQYNVPSILIEGQSVEERCKHPQAHFLNTRSMEILKQIPQVYSQLCDQMTPVHQWSHFQFGYNMLPATALARVHHPVDRPLQANVDANGTLVDSCPQTNSHSRPLSACSVGHLAQHTFCKILHDGAQTQALPDTQLLYSTRAIQLHNNNNNTGMFEIQTDTGLTIHSPVCVAADGAHSLARQRWGIKQVGQVGIQHLLNIHVKTCPDWARQYLHDQGGNYAMLYSTFHPNVVAMIVCHSVGEYVFQVPFFPPYQSLEDYTPERVQQMVYDAMGVQDHTEQSRMDVVSVKAWTMSSLIADQYYYYSAAENGGGVGYLVGDAAHVFPPAGGLGMNTGMQDVYSLAWKLACAFHQGQLGGETLPSIGKSYETERRPVAQFNAALSVRNYNRILEITKACYLNDQHPTLLIKGLDASSVLVPFPARREIFQRLYNTATWTLSSLRDPTNPYTKHLRQNIRRILERGGGLPLLFPEAEIGFGYTNHHQSTNHSSSLHRSYDQDTMGFTPKIKVGHLFPHVEASIVSPLTARKIFPGLKLLENHSISLRGSTSISLTDLPPQVSRDFKPCFVLFCVSSTGGASLSSFKEAAKSLSKEKGMNVEVVEVLPSSAAPSLECVEGDDDQHLTLLEVAHPVEGSLLDSYADSVWLLRPDGHVAGQIWSGGNKTVDELQQIVAQLAKQALSGRAM